MAFPINFPAELYTDSLMSTGDFCNVCGPVGAGIYEVGFSTSKIMLNPVDEPRQGAYYIELPVGNWVVVGTSTSDLAAYQLAGSPTP